MRKYIVTKQELWENDCEIIGIFDTFEKAKKVVPTSTIWEDDDHYIIYEEIASDGASILWTIKVEGSFEMKDICFDGLTMEELENLSRNASKELARRKEQEQKEDWEKVVTTLKAYIKKYGEIEIDCGYDDLILDEEADFPKTGIIHPSLYNY